MGRRYTGRFNASTIPATNAIDVFEYTAPSTGIAKVVECCFGIVGTAKFGDAQSEGINVSFVRGSSGSTSGSGGSSLTPVAHEDGDAAADGVLEALNTTVMVAGGGSVTTCWDEPFFLQLGFAYRPKDGIEWFVSPSNRFAVRLPVGPATVLTTIVAGHFTFEEIGGA